MAVSLICSQIVVLVSESQSLRQITDIGLLQIDKFYPTESKLETESGKV